MTTGVNQERGLRSLRKLVSRGQGDGPAVMPSHDPQRALDFLHGVLEARMRGIPLQRHDGFAVAAAMGILAHERWRIDREDKLHPPERRDLSRLTVAELDAAIEQAERELVTR